MCISSTFLLPKLRGRLVFHTKCLYIPLIYLLYTYFTAQAYNAEKAGAKAIIVMDYKDERLLTMAVPEDRPEIAALKNDITIPTALITQQVGAKIKEALHARDAAPVVVELDWKESVLHEDDRCAPSLA